MCILINNINLYKYNKIKLCSYTYTYTYTYIYIFKNNILNNNYMFLNKIYIVFKYLLFYSYYRC